MDVFLDEMHHLHRKGSVHRDISTPSDITGLPFDNILLTNSGIPLLDIGISALLSKVGKKLFEKYVETELS